MFSRGAFADRAYERKASDAGTPDEVRIRMRLLSSSDQRQDHVATRRSNSRLAQAFVLAGSVSLATAAGGMADESTASRPSAPFSPHARAEFPTRVYFGDTHLHTALSADAVAWGVRLNPEDAYRFARGEEVTASGGERARLSRPLDFLVVADHAEAYGLLREAIEGNPILMLAARAREAGSLFRTVTDESRTALSKLIQGNSNKSTQPKDGFFARMVRTYVMRNIWHHAVAVADAYNEPGRFTTLIGYEWTSGPAGDNLHRVVVFRDDAEKTSQVLPFSSDDSEDPEDLWNALEEYERTTGGRAIAIPHNGNLSNGRMFELVDFRGKPFTDDYAKRRARFEPVMEVTQIKGDGEAHPFLSPNDEFADYETWDRSNLILSTPKTRDMLEFEYARSTLKNGLALEAKLGVNPFRYGMIGSSDAHTGLCAVEEDNFFGKHTGVEPSETRATGLFWRFDDEIVMGWEQASTGYAAVWATDNTREAIFGALERKEVYATTGSRITVRFFGGWRFTPADAHLQVVETSGYTKGVPMGGELGPRNGDAAPVFIVAALRDPLGANLDRIQIIKGWRDAAGVLQEKVYDVIWSNPGRRTIDRATGKLAEVGNTVDVANATWENSIGDPELAAVWSDPAFDPSERAFYYARVLEIPTPRWPAYDAQRFSITLPPDVPVLTQERAYTSPIWYTPAGKSVIPTVPGAER